MLSPRFAEQEISSSAVKKLVKNIRPATRMRIKYGGELFAWPEN
jgi:hypothetical protein